MLLLTDTALTRPETLDIPGEGRQHLWRGGGGQLGVIGGELRATAVAVGAYTGRPQNEARDRVATSFSRRPFLTTSNAPEPIFLWAG